MERLKDQVLFSFMSEEVALDCVDKRRMYPVAQTCGLTVPETFLPVCSGDGTGDLSSFERFPCVVKPAAKFEMRNGRFCSNFGFYAVYQTKALRCQDKRELVRKFDDVREAGFTAIVQEEIQGSPRNLWAIDFYCSHDSVILGHHTGRKMRQYPSDFGTCTFGRSEKREELYSLCATLTKAIGFHGIGNIEFKERDGKLYFLEINPRAWQWLQMASASGVNLPLVAYSDMIGARGSMSHMELRKPVFWVDLRRDTKHIRWRDRRILGTGELSFLRWLNSVRHARVEAMSSLLDPLPLLVIVLRKFLRAGLSRIRIGAGGDSPVARY
jgi:predicted ATP-grasp superfamily ATP-dependent carboligase